MRQEPPGGASAALGAAAQWLAALAATSAQVSAGDADDTQVAGLRLHALTCVSLAVGCVCAIQPRRPPPNPGWLERWARSLTQRGPVGRS